MIRIITALALRLFAMYLLTTLAMTFVLFVVMQSGIIGALPHGEGARYDMAVLGGFAVGAGIVALLWWLGRSALRDAGRVDAASAHAVSAVTVQQLQRILFLLLGVYFSVEALQTLVLKLTIDANILIHGFHMSPPAWTNLAAPLTELLLGLAIVVIAVGPRVALRYMARKHRV